MDVHTRTITVCTLNLCPDTLSLIKSLLMLRPEHWLWTDAPEAAQWWLVDADRPVETRTVVRSFGKTVLAFASDFSHLPTPAWTFLAKPPRSHLLMRVFDHHAAAPGTIAEPGAMWRHCRFRLRCPPDLSRFSATPALERWCAELCRRPVAYVQLVAVLPVALVHALLDDATSDDNLETIRDDPRTAESADAGLWTRLRVRWGVPA